MCQAVVIKAVKTEQASVDYSHSQFTLNTTLKYSNNTIFMTITEKFLVNQQKKPFMYVGGKALTFSKGAFLAVQDSSITDIVCPLVPWSV